MTQINGDKVVRGTEVLYMGKQIIVELHKQYMTLRVKGRRTGVEAGSNLGYEAALRIAMNRAVGLQKEDS